MPLALLAAALSLAAPLAMPLDSAKGLTLLNARAAAETYRGRKAIHLLPLEGHEQGNDELLALVDGTDLHDGSLEVDLAGAPRPGTDPTSRGFIGLAFRVQAKEGPARFECFYLRPTNGRADDQLQRNHAAQYVSSPDYSWRRLRAETPGKYESWVDLEAGAWTHVRITFAGASARLYVNGAKEPTLVVNDLKLGADAKGAVALWSHESTDGYFADLKIQ